MSEFSTNKTVLNSVHRLPKDDHNSYSVQHSVEIAPGQLK